MLETHLHIEGIVQGVCFRAKVKEKATSLHLTGYVRNLTDGSVEAVIQGEEEVILSLISFIKELPLPVSIHSLKIKKISRSQDFSNFEIRK